jgi:hypothetical protein
MNPLRRVRRWRRARRRRHAAIRSDAPLREFIYLDEVSVYSLLASRIGAIATEFSESETASLQSEIDASISAGVAPVSKGSLSSRLQSAQTSGSQVLRKAIVQTTFKELYEYEQARLRLRPLTLEDGEAPSRPAELVRAGRGATLVPWLIDPDSLARGELVEVEVELSAEPIFRMSTVISALVEMMRESDELARAAGAATDLEQMGAVANVIERLLVGLIPIRGRAIDYCVIEYGGREWIVHQRLAEHLLAEGALRRELLLVGVADEALFWRDIRRVLFSNSRYRVLCRVSRPGIQESWTPVKLVEVLKDVLPDVAAQLDVAAAGFVGAATDAEADATEAANEVGSVDGLAEYAVRLAAQRGRELSPVEREEVASAAVAHAGTLSSVNGRVRALRAVAAFVAERFGVEVEAETAARLREPFLTRLTPMSDVADSHELPPPTDGGVAGRFLDSEFVAIYW